MSAEISAKMENKMAENGGKQHYSLADDVLLLKESNEVEPWQARKVMDTWFNIADVLSKIPSFPKGKDGRSIRSRFHTLLSKYRNRATVYMRNAGDEDDFRERSELLSEIDTKMAAFERQKASENPDSRRWNKRQRERDEEEERYGPGSEMASEASDTMSNVDDGRTQRTHTHVTPERLRAAAENRGVGRSDKLARMHDQPHALSYYQKRKLELLEEQVAQQQTVIEIQQEQLRLQHEQVDKQTVMHQQQLQIILDLVRKTKTTATTTTSSSNNNSSNNTSTSTSEKP